MNSPGASDPGSVLPSARRRLLPDLTSVLLIYVLTGLGILAFSSSFFGLSDAIAETDSRSLALILSVLPLASLAIFLLRLRELLLDTRRRRYGSALRVRLSLLFILTVAAASIPQGIFVMSLGRQAQRAAASEELKRGLSEGLGLLVSYYDEDLARLERIADRELPRLIPADGRIRAEPLLAELRELEPRIEAVEAFGSSGGRTFAGSSEARLASPPSGRARGLLPTSTAGGVGRLRYAVGIGKAVAVITLRLPENFDASVSALANAGRKAEELSRESKLWPDTIFILYILFVLPLLLFALLLGISAADLVAEPLIGLEDATRRIASGDFGLRLLVKPKDETGRLIASFNRMLAEIERYREGELRKEKIDAWKDIAQRLAHELKNPLTPIRLTAERLLRAKGKNPDRALEILDSSMLAIVSEVEGMDNLLKDFRSFASLPEPQKDWVRIEELIEESLALYRSSYPEVDFRTEDLPQGLSLRVDKAQIKRVIGNLVANSVEAMGGRGTIRIGADLVKTSESRYCRLRIDDTGAGIPPDLAGRVFSPYFTTKEKGTGLGLSIAQRIVEDHGGSIRFESEEGLGTSFYIDLALEH